MGDTSRISRSRSTLLPGLGLAVALLGALGVLGVGAPTAAGTVDCTGFQQPSAEVMVMSAAHLATIATCVNGGHTNAGLRVTVVSSFSIPSGTAITPIGTSGFPFLGVFDGNEYTISGVSVTGGSSDQQGLFGVVGNATTGATIKNLRLASPSVTGRTDVGALVGRLDAGTIQNVRITGATVSGTDAVGVLVGDVSAERSPVIRDVHASGTATASTLNAGVLAGSISIAASKPNRTVTLQRIDVAGSAAGTQQIGGAIGTAYLHGASARLVVEDVAVRASAARSSGASNGFGGLLGQVIADAPETGQAIDLTRVYVTGAVAADAAAGAFVAYSGGSGSVTYGGAAGTLLWDEQTTGMTTAMGAAQTFLDGRAVRLQTADLKALATYTASPAWPIVTAWATAGSSTAEPWGICASVDGGYPFLRTILGATACQWPSAPTIGTATPTGRTSATVTFTAGAAGDAPITGYEYSLDNGTSWQAPETATATSPLIATGLTPGTTHQIKVRALNPFGEGDPTVSAASVTSAACRGSNLQVLEEAGTAGDPYLIGSADDLRAIGTGTCPLDAHHRQTADIALDPVPAAPSSVASNFTPIGLSSFSGFFGAYDGDGHRITGLVYEDRRVSPAGKVGLFSAIAGGADVRDLDLVDVRIRGAENVGGLAGIVDVASGGGTTTIEGVTVTGTVTGTGAVGGLLGKATASGTGAAIRVADAAADVDVDVVVLTPSDPYLAEAGGLIGVAQASGAAGLEIDGVRAIGAVTAPGSYVQIAGGLIGRLGVASGSGSPTGDVVVSDARATGAVAVQQAAGGLIGSIRLSTAARALRLERVGATGAVTAGANAGGLIGVADAFGTGSTTIAAGILEIIDGYAGGDVVEAGGVGATTFGGLIGQARHVNALAGGSLELERVYARGAVPTGGKGLVGERTMDRVVPLNPTGFWDGQTTGAAASGFDNAWTAGTTAQMRAIAYYADAASPWPIVPLWQAPAAGRTWGLCASVNGGYPYLLMEYDAMPCAVPAAPTGLEATAGDGSAAVAFTAGAANDSPITGYEASVDGGAWAAVAGTTGPFTFTGLANGRTYAIRLRALSAVGAGAASEAVAVTPAAPVTPVVAASPAGTLQRARFTAMAGGRVRVRATVTGPGRVVVTGTRAGVTARAKARPLCTARATVKKAGTVTLFCTLTRAARAQLARGPLRVRITAAYTPTGGTATAMAQVVALPRTARG